jgi:hypothetical protein
MTVFTEGNLQITFPSGVAAKKFDHSGHGLTHCMKAVDLIVELIDRYLFIEFKDPEHPDSRKKDRKKFVEQFLSGKIDEDFKYKYRDSFLYEWASGKTSKPVYYYVLVAIDTYIAGHYNMELALARLLLCAGCHRYPNRG